MTLPALSSHNMVLADEVQAVVERASLTQQKSFS